jgi:hypothetical protein
MSPMTEQRTFHAPGTWSTWFPLFRPPAPVPPPPTTVIERQTLLAERDREQGRWEEEQRGYERRSVAARERLAEARALLREAETFAAECEAEALTASLNHDVRVRRLEERVRGGASEHIATFLRDVRDQLEALRGRGVLDVTERWSRRDPATLAHTHQFLSNADSVARRAAALTAAHRAAEALQLEPLDEEALLARLTVLRDAIPAIEPLLVQAADPFTPGERREIAWRLAEQQEARR